MTDTPRAINYLLTQEQQDGQAPGSFTLQRQRDLTVTLQKRTPIYRVTDPEFGAINSGSGNAASTVYANLAALQAVYGATVNGTTVALTQELDWLAAQLAIQTATTNGGIVYFPPGAGYVFTNANSVSDGSGTLNLPQVNWPSPNKAVSLVGDVGGSILNWPNDLGSGKFGILCGGRAANQSVGLIRGLVLVGPGVGAVLNASTTSMQGIGTNDRRAIYSCSIYNFNIGVNVVGGQFYWEDVHIFNCFYGIYLDNPQSANYGDMCFVRVISEACNKACIGIHKNAFITGCAFLGCAFSTSPFAIFKESGGTSNLAVTQSHFSMCQFENLGNALIADDLTTSTRIVIISYTRFTYPEFEWSSSNKIAALPAYAIIDVAELDWVEFDGFRNTNLWTPGSGATFSVNNIQGLTLTGDIVTLLANATTAVIPFLLNPGITTGIRVINNGGAGGGDNSQWDGTIGFSGDTTQVANNIVIKNSSGSANNVLRCAGATSDAVLGVEIYNATPGVSGGCVVYANQGTVQLATSGTVNQAAYVRTSTAGVAVAATGSNDTTTPIIGVALTAASGNVCTVRLRGLA